MPLLPDTIALLRRLSDSGDDQARVAISLLDSAEQKLTLGVSYTDLVALGGTSQTLVLSPALPANARIHQIIFDFDTLFDDGSSLADIKASFFSPGFPGANGVYQNANWLVLHRIGVYFASSPASQVPHRMSVAQPSSGDLRQGGQQLSVTVTSSAVAPNPAVNFSALTQGHMSIFIYYTISTLG